MFEREHRRNITIEELESDYHFPNLLEDLDFVIYSGLLDR